MTIAPEHPATITHDNMVFEPWITAEAIDQRVTEIAQHLGALYTGQQVRLITVLRGAQPFADLLLAKLQTVDNGPSQIITDTLRVKSYEGTQSTGNLRWLQDLTRPTHPEIHDVLIEDIIDSGRTLSLVTEELLARNPASLRSVVLLDRPEGRAEGINYVPDVIGFHITDVNAWAIGFGLDLDVEYRDLPHIYGKVVDGQSPPPYTIPALPKA
jgi:hypoxanthine phosphoribosyltransferase